MSIQRRFEDSGIAHVLLDTAPMSNITTQNDAKLRKNQVIGFGQFAGKAGGSKVVLRGPTLWRRFGPYFQPCNSVRSSRNAGEGPDNDGFQKFHACRSTRI